jgi:L-gulonate 3-dehydrogenase
METSHGTVALIGAGLIGRAWAAIFSRAGWNVRLTDTDDKALAAAPELIRKELEMLSHYGLASDPAAAAGRIAVAPTLHEALDGASFVQENGPEKLEIKREIFAALDERAPPGVILSSSSSAIMPSLFTEGLMGRHRCLVSHPINPPHLVPVVELCGASWTSKETIATARGVFQGIGQVPVALKREVDGFIVNRLQGALLAEAFRLVGEGYVTPEDLDHTISDGLGLRWSFMGPFETIELNAPGGIPDYCARYTDFYKRVAAEAGGPEVYEEQNLARIVAEWPHDLTPERLAARTNWRNARLAALIAHKRSQKGG